MEDACPITDLAELIARAEARPESRASRIHGVHHWKCVAWTGLQLLMAGVDADPWVVFLFSVLHDSQRNTDAHDPLHGRKAAAFAAALNGGAFALDDKPLALLEEACAKHSDGLLSTDPTIAVCWDADRLNLWRVGRSPEPRFLSTSLARLPKWLEAARCLQSQRFEWAEIYSRYQRGRAEELREAL